MLQNVQLRKVENKLKRILFTRKNSKLLSEFTSVMNIYNTFWK